MAECAYCLKDTELKCSHSIPDAFFKLISRQTNGQLIAIPRGEGKIYLTQETGKVDLLCQSCEQLFNHNFDSPLVNKIKKWDRQFIEKKTGAVLDFSANHLAQGLASVFWRASVSRNDLYAGASISDGDKAKLLSIVNADQKDVLKMCSCSVSRLFDKLSSKDGGFEQEALSKVILPVNAYSISLGGSKQEQTFAFSAVFQGFIFHLFIPKLPYKLRSKPSYMKPGGKRLRAPMTLFSDYDPLMQAIFAGKKKHEAGHSNLKR